jgi:exonuclease III
MSNKFCIGTWNVKTLLKPGKMQELAEELAKTQLEIAAIQETRWSRTRLIKKKIFHYTTVELKIK